MNRFLHTLAFICLVSSFTYAQPPGGGLDPSKMTSGMIGGLVFNLEEEIPFEYANVTVNDMDGKMIKGIVTNTEGKFMIKEIPFDQLVSLDVSFIGFKHYKKDSILLTKADPVLRIGKVNLETDVALLEEVVVKGERAIVQTSLDKKTYNVEKSTITKSKTVSDILNELPSVTVEADGTISLRGNSNVRILVDGESSMSESGQIELILEQMPAEAVEKIDVVTNPSAKYDPEGTSGIINIILKKEKQRGVNGTVSAGVGSWNKYNAATFISYRKNKLGLTANYNFRYYDSQGDGTTSRTTMADGFQTFLNQSSSSEYDNMSHFGRIGFNVTPNDKNTISFGGLTTVFVFNRDSELYTLEEDDSGETLLENLRTIIFNGNGRFTSANIYHTYDFDKENSNMKYGLNFSNFNGNFDGGYDQDSISESEYFFDTEVETEVDAISYNLDAIWDFTLPITENMSEEAGLKSTFRWRVGDFISRSKEESDGAFKPDYRLSNEYEYFEQIHAIYATHIHSVKNFSYQIGLRLEQVNTSILSVSTLRESFERNYFSYYPSVFLRQAFGEEDGQKHEVQFSYSRRVNRPSFRITNPFRDYSDPLNPREGNPTLQPEYISSFELGYNKIWPKVTFNTSVYYKLTEDLYSRVAELIDEENNIVLTTYENLGTQHDFGWEIINKYKLLDWWDINLDFHITQTKINGNEEFATLSNSGLSYSGKISSTMNVWKGLEIQLIGRYRGPRITTQGERDGYGTLDITLKQDILKKKGTISFSANDLTNTVKRASTVNGDGFTTISESKRETRVFWLSFSYGFGKMGEIFNKRSGRGDRNGNGDDNGDEGVF